MDSKSPLLGQHRSGPIRPHREEAPVSGSCPACDGGTLVRRTNLVFADRVGAVAVRVANLHGYECAQCNSVWYTPESAQHIRDARQERPVADYEIKVTRIGGRSLGVYFPKDLVRVMDLEAGVLGFASRVDDDTIAIRFTRDEEEVDDDALDDDMLLS